MKKSLRTQLSQLVVALLYTLLIVTPFMHIAGFVCPHGSGASHAYLEFGIHSDDFRASLKESHDLEHVDSDCPFCSFLTSCFSVKNFDSKSPEIHFALIKGDFDEDSPLFKKIIHLNFPTGPPSV